MRKIVKQPRNALIAVTYRCNSKCRMCNIWKKQIDTDTELRPENYKELPKNLDEVNITGGEPFLRDDLIEILDTIFETSTPKKIVIPTNGFLTGRIITAAKEIQNRSYGNTVTIAISLDGIGDAHDGIRGVKGAYDMVIKTVKKLQKINFLNIGFGFTFISGNEDEYEKVYDLSKKLNINFGVSYFHNSDNYFSNSEKDISPDSKKIKRVLNKDINERIKSFSKNELGKCYYLHGLIYYIKNKKRLLPCDALSGSFFLDPFGEIYPCNILNKSIGNLKGKSFNEIWQSQEANNLRSLIKKCPTPCWMVCTAKPAIKKHWFRVGLWILISKIKRLI